MESPIHMIGDFAARLQLVRRQRHTRLKSFILRYNILLHTAVENRAIMYYATWEKNRILLS